MAVTRYYRDCGIIKWTLTFNGQRNGILFYDLGRKVGTYAPCLLIYLRHSTFKAWLKLIFSILGFLWKDLKKGLQLIYRSVPEKRSP